MTKQFRVIEKQVHVVAYYVTADNEEMAREHVGMLAQDEYDEEIDEYVRVVNVKEIG